MFCINTHKRLKKALLCLELYTKVGRATDVHEENNYRKLEIGFLENVLVRFNTQSYIELKTFIKMPPAQKNSPLRSDWSLDYLTLRYKNALLTIATFSLKAFQPEIRFTLFPLSFLTNLLQNKHRTVIFRFLFLNI